MVRRRGRLLFSVEQGVLCILISPKPPDWEHRHPPPPPKSRLADLLPPVSHLWSLGSQLVELKNGETYNGHLQSCDHWMNLNLREVTLTSRVRPYPPQPPP